MKKIIILLLAALSLFSCQPEDPSIKPEKDKDVAFISINSFETKCQIGTNSLIAWSEGDKVGVLGEGEPAEFCLTSGAGYSVASFEGEKPEGEEFVVYYPSTATCDSITFRGVLDPRVTHGVPDHPLGIVPMWGKASDLSSVTLSAICGILRLEMKGSVAVKSILLDAGKPVSGSFMCSLGEGLFAITGGANTILMDVGNAELISTRPVPFYFILPPGEYDSITLTVTDSEDEVTFITIDDVIIEAGFFTPAPIDMDSI